MSEYTNDLRELHRRSQHATCIAIAAMAVLAILFSVLFGLALTYEPERFDDPWREMLAWMCGLGFFAAMFIAFGCTNLDQTADERAAELRGEIRTAREELEALSRDEGGQ